PKPITVKSPQIERVRAAAVAAKADPVRKSGAAETVDAFLARGGKIKRLGAAVYVPATARPVGFKS
ncbi:MAG: hypothetical protein ABIR55_08880, partial [Burkholderiaceae bacterium]